MGEIADGITVVLIFMGLSTPLIVVALVYYLKKRLEHKQILAAIEKGTPLSELRPPEPTGRVWIKNLTAGIAFLIIAIGLFCIQLPRLSEEGFVVGHEWFGHLLISVILFGVGISLLIRGLLQRKYPPQEPPTGLGDTRESKNPQNP